MTPSEQHAIIAISLLAAFTDGNKDEREREQIKQITEGLAPNGDINMSGLYQDVLLKRRTLEQSVAQLESHEAQQLAYEMAVCVCDADGVRSESENAFLQRLQGLLKIDAEQAQAFAKDADALADMPLVALPIESGPTVDNAALDKSVLNYSILNGALELLPQSLASMAILPLQMKMVYSIGKAHGFELDREHIKDFAATLGVGMTGQYVEQMGRKLLGGLLGKLGGGLLGGLGSAATGAAFSFATTYALGKVAQQYYAGGRKIDATQLKQVFATMFSQGKQLQTQYTAQIEQKAQTIDVNQILDMVKRQ
ncbi:MAG: TerB family tellurite resistance protein [Arenimonas sp.]|nr:TerB family tellurite resistance protein [Arenimonas sp.]